MLNDVTNVNVINSYTFYYILKNCALDFLFSQAWEYKEKAPLCFSFTHAHSASVFAGVWLFPR